MSPVNLEHHVNSRMNGSFILSLKQSASSSCKTGPRPPHFSSCQSPHSSCLTHHTVQLPTSIAIAKRSFRILIFTIKALIIISALFACSACLVTYRRKRKNRDSAHLSPAVSPRELFVTPQSNATPLHWLTRLKISRALESHG